MTNQEEPKRRKQDGMGEGSKKRTRENKWATPVFVERVWKQVEDEVGFPAGPAVRNRLHYRIDEMYRDGLQSYQVAPTIRHEWQMHRVLNREIRTLREQVTSLGGEPMSYKESQMKQRPRPSVVVKHKRPTREEEENSWDEGLDDDELEAPKRR